MANQPDYYTELEHLEAELNTDKNSSTQLAALQVRLDELMYTYRNDTSLGTDRFGLYQIQAMISFRLGDFTKSKRFIDYAVAVKGSSFTVAEQLYGHLKRKNYQKKSGATWWGLIITPPIALLLIAVLQVVAHLLLNSSRVVGVTPSPTPLTEVISVVSILAGLVSVILLVLLPLWVIQLVDVRHYNENHGYGNGLRKRNGVLIAIFLPLWYWCYTYRTNSGRFWLNFILSAITAGCWMIIGWPWAIIQASIRPEEFYALYPYYEVHK